MLVVSGLLAGSMHVVSGPDHLVALAPLALNDPKRAYRVGAIWGLGHGLGVAAVAGLGMLVKGYVDVESISAWSEFLVGFALVVLGVWAVYKAGLVTIHTHAHSQDANQNGQHDHYHVHVGVDHDSEVHASHTHMVLGVGVLHGAAGTGHLFGVIPALALPPASATIYVVAYLVAAVISMALFAGFLGQFFQRSGQRVLRGVMKASGLAAILLGVVWAVNGWPLTE